MSLDIHQRDAEGIAVFDLKGRLTIGEASRLRDMVLEQAPQCGNRVIFNLEDLDYIDSTGLGTMVHCFTVLKKAGGALKLVNLNKRSIELLYLTKLHSVFETFSEEQDAVNSFFPNRDVKRFDILSFVKQQSDED